MDNGLFSPANFFPLVDANLQNFTQSIQSEIKDGSLVPSEQDLLNNELLQMQQLENADKQKLFVPFADQYQLWNALSGMNRDIYSLSHNALGTTLPDSPSGNATPLVGMPGTGNPFQQTGYVDPNSQFAQLENQQLQQAQQFVDSANMMQIGGMFSSIFGALGGAGLFGGGFLGGAGGLLGGFGF